MDSKVENILSETKYHDGVMIVTEIRTKCSTPVREEDICIEKIFTFIKNDNSSEY
jgi:hypothetical protein